MELPIRAVIGRRGNGRPGVLAVQLDGFNDQAEGIDAVALACRAVGFDFTSQNAFAPFQAARPTRKTPAST